MPRRHGKLTRLEGICIALGVMTALGLLTLFPVPLRGDDPPPPPASCAEAIQSSVLHRWSMDSVGPDGTIPDDVGGAPGTLQGGASLAPGWIQKGLLLDNTAKYLKLSPIPDMHFTKANPFSISLWVKTSDADGSLLAKGGKSTDNYAGYGLKLQGNKLQFTLTRRVQKSSATG